MARTSAVIAAAVLAGQGLVTAALAQEPPAALMLTCEGDDIAIEATGTSTTVVTQPGVDPGIGSAQHRAQVMANTARTTTNTAPVYGRVRVPARMSIAIQGDAIRVRPSENTKPGWTQKKSADGWYALTGVSISDTHFRGQAAYGGLFGKYRLSVDRQTGDAQFGDFRGVCEKSATGPAERKF